MTIVDRDTLLVNRLCQIHNDPHIRTFDGRIYDYMEVGEYVMYRNDKGPYMVNNYKNYKISKFCSNIMQEENFIIKIHSCL